MPKPETVKVGCAATNYRKGRPGSPDKIITAVVIHLIDGSLVGCDATFLNATLEIKRSAHYAVGKTGVIHEYVDEKDTAYHTGNVLQPTWGHLQKDAAGRFINPNYYTIGVEHEGRVNDEWTDAMYASSASLLRYFSETFPNLAHLERGVNVVMHREIRADKACPGFKVDLDRLIAEATSGASVIVQPLSAGAVVGGGVAVTPVVTTVRLNVRSAPNALATYLRTLDAGDNLTPLGFTRDGQAVNGNSNWYKIADKEFVWAGGTSQPNPT